MKNYKNDEFIHKKIDKAAYYAYKCPSCYENGHCNHCGCPFIELIESNIECNEKTN